MVEVISPDVILVKEPILTGLENDPEVSDNCAVNTLPELKFILAVKGTGREMPLHRFCGTASVTK